MHCTLEEFTSTSSYMYSNQPGAKCKMMIIFIILKRDIFTMFTWFQPKVTSSGGKLQAPMSWCETRQRVTQDTHNWIHVLNRTKDLTVQWLRSSQSTLFYLLLLVDLIYFGLCEGPSTWLWDIMITQATHTFKNTFIHMIMMILDYFITHCTPQSSYSYTTHTQHHQNNILSSHTTYTYPTFNIHDHALSDTSTPTRARIRK